MLHNLAILSWRSGCVDYHVTLSQLEGEGGMVRELWRSNDLPALWRWHLTSHWKIASVLVFIVETIFPPLSQNTEMGGECGKIFEWIGNFPETENTIDRPSWKVGTATNSQLNLDFLLISSNNVINHLNNGSLVPDLILARKQRFIIRELQTL